jgi:hypothetical protein
MLAGCTASVITGAVEPEPGAEYELLQAASNSKPNDAIARKATTQAVAENFRSNVYMVLLQTPIWRQQ